MFSIDTYIMYTYYVRTYYINIGPTLFQAVQTIHMYTPTLKSE